MDRLSIVTLGAAKAYTNASIAGGGAIKGKNCQIKSSTPITGGTRIVFAWYLDNGTEQTTTVDVMDGAKGDTGNGVKSASIVNNHLILTLDDDTTVDAGLLTNLDTTFEHIDDISLNNLVDGQILKFNAITGKWENASAGTVDTSLVDLNDVDVDNLTDGQIIVWDATAGRWKNANNSPSITVDPTPTQGSDNAVASGGVYTALQGKANSSDVPTKTSDLTNDSNFVADASYVHTDNNYTSADKTIVGGVTAALADKVDKVSGKGLSTNDYTTAEQTKLAGVTTGANRIVKTEYTLASNSWSSSSVALYEQRFLTNPMLDANYPVNVYLGTNSVDPFPDESEIVAYNDSIVGGLLETTSVDPTSYLTIYASDIPSYRGTPTTLKIWVEGVLKEVD